MLKVAAYVFIAVFSFGQAFAIDGPTCRRALKLGQEYSFDKQSTYQTPQEFLKAAERWQVSDTQVANEDRSEWPKSFKRDVTIRERWRAMEAVVKLGRFLSGDVPKQMQKIANEYASGTQLPTFLKEFAQLLRDSFGVSYAIKKQVDEGADNLMNDWRRETNSTFFNELEISESVKIHNNYDNFIKDLQSKYGEDMVNEEVILGGGWGQMAAQGIVTALDLSGHYKSIFSLSLLHPILDNAIDRGGNIGPTLKKITKLLDGERVVAENSFEKLVFELITNMQTEFPANEHPVFHETLRQLHAAQIRSAQIQKDPNATYEDLVKITLEKGGYAGVAYAYATAGHLTNAEAEFFYKVGSHLQFGDDLLDYKEDLKEGINTVWTRTLGGPKEHRFDALNLFNRLEADLEVEAETLLKDHPKKEKLIETLSSGYRFYLASAYLNSDLGPLLAPKLKSKFPFDPENFRRVTLQMASYVRAAVTSDPKLNDTLGFLLSSLDLHFLKGELAQFTKENPNAPNQPLRVRSHSPVFYLYKLTDSMRYQLMKYDTSDFYGKLVRLSIPITMYTTNMYMAYHLPPSLQGPAILSGFGAAGTTVLTSSKDVQVRAVYALVGWSIAVSMLTLTQ